MRRGALLGEGLSHLGEVVPFVEEVSSEIVDQLGRHASVMISSLQSSPGFDLLSEEPGERQSILRFVAGWHEFLDLRLGPESPVFLPIGIPMDGVQGSRPAVDAGFDDGVRVFVLHETGGGDIDEGWSAFGTFNRF